MTICFLIAGLFAIFSVFAFFGHAFSNTGTTINPSMFKLMFGIEGTYNGYVIYWKQFAGLTALFVLEILIIVLVLTGFIFLYLCKNKRKILVVIFSMLVLLCTTTSIMSFCTLSITNVNQDGFYEITLGVGPWIYSCMQLVSIALFVVGLALLNNAKKTMYLPSDRKLNNRVIENSNSSQDVNKSELTENEKADLIIKYKKMFDDGILTKEEFETKKTELLNL